MRATEIGIKDAGRAFGDSGVRAIRGGRWWGPGLFPVVVAEFQRAVAAARRYEQLKRADAAAMGRDGISSVDIPRRIFEEFYSSDDGPAIRSSRPDRDSWVDDRSTPPATQAGTGWHEGRRGSTAIGG
jgi:hypothetical protein